MPLTPATPPSRVAVATAVAAAPGVAVLLFMGWLDLAPWSAAIGGSIAVAAGAVAIARLWLGEMAALAAHVRAIAGDRAGRPPATRVWTGGRDLRTALDQVTAARQGETERMAVWRAATTTLIDALPDPLVLLDGERRIVAANKAAAGLFERDPCGHHLSTVLRHPDVLEATEAVLAEGDGRRTVTVVLPGPVRREFQATAVGLPEPVVEGAVGLLVLHDLTEVRRMAQTRADFVANASHELKTPLATLTGFIETLQGPAREDPDAWGRFLPVMHEQATRMARLIDDLLSLSHIELTESSRPTDPVDVAGILERVRNAAQVTADQQNVTLEVNVADGLPVVPGDPDQLAQVVQNLVDNAIKYGGAGSTVRIAAAMADSPPVGRQPELRDGAVAVTVADAGEGIPRADLPRLTERFYRVDKARSRSLGGTGLGLAIVKHILTRHRGALDVESTEGEGSIFTVYLPVAAAAGQSTEDA